MKNFMEKEERKKHKYNREEPLRGCLKSSTKMYNVTVFLKEILFCSFPTYRQAGVRSVRQAKKEFLSEKQPF